MSLAKSILAFPDCKDLLDRAIESEGGVKVTCETAQDAVKLRHKCNWFRTLHRKENMKIYEEGHSLHGNSHYDILRLRLVGAEMVIEKVGPLNLKVENL